ncbi:MAG: hypothetical protein R3C32_02235 [Chloroflexota bacterium]
MELRWADEMPPVLNDPRLVARALEAAEGEVPARVSRMPPMTADDFALLAQGRPALYLARVGTREHRLAAAPQQPVRRGRPMGWGSSGRGSRPTQPASVESRGRRFGRLPGREVSRPDR